MSREMVAHVKDYNQDRNTVTAWASTDAIDRSGEVIDPKGWDLENFKKNPVLLPFHQYYVPPVGKVINITAQDKGLLFEAEFANTEEGREMAELYRDGFMSAFSVGFIPKSWDLYKGDGSQTNDYWEASKVVFTAAELLEISVVSVPDNQDALVSAVNEGRIKTKTAARIVDTLRKHNPLVPHKIEFDGGEGGSGQTKDKEVKATDAENESSENRADTEPALAADIKALVKEAIKEIKQEESEAEAANAELENQKAKQKPEKKKAPELKTIDVSEIIKRIDFSAEIPYSKSHLEKLKKRGVVQV